MSPIDLPLKILRYGSRFFESDDSKDMRSDYCSFSPLPKVIVRLRPTLLALFQA